MGTDAVACFNLVDEPWIPVLDREGSVHDVSLLGLFEESGDLVQIVGDVPTQVFAFQRLLLAVLHRAVEGPADLEHWRAVRDDWQATTADVRAYLTHFRDRFDLRHATQPFFQVAGLRTAKDEASGLEKLIADVPNGEPYLSMRLGAALERITWAEAARWLVHVHAFDPAGIRSGAVGDPRVKGGRGYPIGPGWAGQIGGVSLVGGTVRETLLLNLVVGGRADLTVESDDHPVWERAPLTSCEEVPGGRHPTGPVDLYTWQTRRVRLVGDDAGVRGVVLAQGDRATPQNRHRLEPMSAWRFSEPQTKKLGLSTYMPRKHQPERAFWRGLASILPDNGSTVGGAPAAALPPGVVRWASALRDGGLLRVEDVIRVRATGIAYGANESVVAEMIDDELVLPSALLRGDAQSLRTTAVDAVEQSETAVRSLAQLAGNLAAAAGAGDTDGPRDRARELAYAALDVPFRAWLATLTDDEPTLDSAARWQREARRILWGLSRELVEDASVASWVGRQVLGRHVDTGQADAWFRRSLSQALPRGWAEAGPERPQADSPAGKLGRTA